MFLSLTRSGSGGARSVLGAGPGPDEIYQSANFYRSSRLLLSSFEVSCGLVHNFTPFTATIARILCPDQLSFETKPEPHWHCAPKSLLGYFEDGPYL